VARAISPAATVDTALLLLLLQLMLTETDAYIQLSPQGRQHTITHCLRHPLRPAVNCTVPTDLSTTYAISRTQHPSIAGHKTDKNLSCCCKTARRYILLPPLMSFCFIPVCLLACSLSKKLRPDFDEILTQI